MLFESVSNLPFLSSCLSSSSMLNWLPGLFLDWCWCSWDWEEGEVEEVVEEVEV